VSCIKMSCSGKVDFRKVQVGGSRLDIVQRWKPMSQKRDMGHPFLW
jgi:hypothetical protein